MSPVFFTLDFPDAEKVSRAVIIEAMPDMAQVVYEETLPRVPVGATGKLKAGLGIRIRKGGTEGHIGVFGARHAHLVMRGTPPHVIKARNARALRFSSGGVFVMRGSVQHPGARKQPFLEEGLKASKEAMMAALRQHMEDYLRRAVGKP